jgi:hypothetical protein
LIYCESISWIHSANGDQCECDGCDGNTNDVEGGSVDEIGEDDDDDDGDDVSLFIIIG